MIDLSDAQLHAELNHHDRLRRIKAIRSALRSLEQACHIVNAAHDDQLSPSVRTDKQMTLTEIDGILDRIAAAFIETTRKGA